MGTTVWRDNKAVRRQRPNLMMHHLNETRSTVHDQHRSSAAKGFVIDSDAVDVSKCASMRLAGCGLPDSEPQTIGDSEHFTEAAYKLSDYRPSTHLRFPPTSIRKLPTARVRGTPTQDDPPGPKRHAPRWGRPRS